MARLHLLLLRLYTACTHVRLLRLLYVRGRPLLLRLYTVRVDYCTPWTVSRAAAWLLLLAPPATSSERRVCVGVA